eukprot:scaffold10127_cov152-Isochrysis_galbana.AAC.3
MVGSVLRLAAGGWYGEWSSKIGGPRVGHECAASEWRTGVHLTWGVPYLWSKGCIGARARRARSRVMSVIQRDYRDREIFYFFDIEIEKEERDLEQ